MGFCDWFKKKPEPQKEYLPEKKNNYLSWNKPQWDTFLLMQVGLAYESLVVAKDWDRIVPGFYLKNRHAQTHILAELIVAMAYYESAWNERSQSVDVGTEKDKNTWSVGLLQVSVCDQKNMNLPTQFTFDELCQMTANIALGLHILCRQVAKTGLIILPNKHPQRYWAVLLDGNKYSRVDQIIARVRKYATLS